MYLVEMGYFMASVRMYVGQCQIIENITREKKNSDLNDTRQKTEGLCQ